MSVSEPSRIPECGQAPSYRAKRFAVLTGNHSCYECNRDTRVSAVGLLGYQESDCESGELETFPDSVLITRITALNGAAAKEVISHAPWMRYATSRTASHSYLANHCEHCNAMIGAWYVQEPGEPFFPATLADARKLSVAWIDQPFEGEGEGGVSAMWLDHLLLEG